MKVIFLCPYPTGCAPSQRFRFEQYFGLLQQSHIRFQVESFTSSGDWETMHKKTNWISKTRILIRGLISRATLLFRLHKFDLVFIHRELAPVGPPVFEWIVSRICRKKIIYDFDDAIWLTDRTDEPALMKALRWRSKVRSICRWSYKISCGNRYLADFARQFNGDVLINPTTVDTGNLHAPPATMRQAKPDITVGWTGSHSTLKYLETIIPALKVIEKKYPKIEFLIIADQKPHLPLKNLVYRQWKKPTEITDLGQINIGIMPLPDDEWTKGKGGFKALQYMAMEVPALVAPVGINKEIVQHGVEGYWCTTNDDWINALEDLILNEEKRIEMGKRGRKKVIDYYSVASNSSNFLSLFQDA
jgi:glycosyltransferase involved in cell wall biosynthesis